MVQTRKIIQCKKCGVEVGVGIEERDWQFKVFTEGELRTKCKLSRGQRIINPTCPHLQPEIKALVASNLPGNDKPLLETGCR
jgi:hypothetical protein